jgi:hypothetical protein
MTALDVYRKGTTRLPNFLIIGAAKSGTTSLWAYLKQHPDVYLPFNKEPNYFAHAGESLPPPGPVAAKILWAHYYQHCVTDFDSYAQLFSEAGPAIAVGEASVRYLYFPAAPGRIREKLPNCRMIAILREPVSRLYSHYCMNIQYQLEPLGLRDAIEAEDARRAAKWGWDWHYVNLGLYAKQLRRFLDLFEREQLKVILYDDFVARPLEAFHEICRHIGVDDRFVPDMSERGKVAYRPRNLVLDRLLHWPRSARSGWERFVPWRIPEGLMGRLEAWNSVPIPRLDGKMRKELGAHFQEDVKELEGLLGRRIPWQL